MVNLLVFYDSLLSTYVEVKADTTVIPIVPPASKTDYVPVILIGAALLTIIFIILYMGRKR